MGSNKASAILLGIAIMLVAACGPDDPAATPGRCGTFSPTEFEVTQLNNNPRPSAHLKVDFNFRPSMCGIQTCTCGKIAYLQLIRITDAEAGGEVLQFNDDQEERMLRDPNNPWVHGWSLDRAEGKDWPYYAMNNDGTFDQIVKLSPTDHWRAWTGFITPGSNTRTATMIDQITYEPRDAYRLDVVQAPVCIDSQSSCANRILGYNPSYYVVSPDPTHGQAIGPLQRNATFPYLDQVMRAAVNNWNEQHEDNQINVNPTP